MPATPTTSEDLFARFATLGIETTTHEHPPLRTVEDGRRYWPKIPGGHCKNLYLRDNKKRNWLVVTLQDREIDLKALARTIGTGRLSFGSAERLMQFLGVAPGAVTPFAMINDPEGVVTVVLDQAMLALDPLNFHPLVNTRTTTIATENLLTFLRATGHEPSIVAL